MLALALSGPGVLPATVYPSPDWARGVPEEHGLNSTKLEQAATLAHEKLKSGCLMVVADGLVVGEWYWKAPVVKELVALMSNGQPTRPPTFIRARRASPLPWLGLLRTWVSST